MKDRHIHHADLALAQACASGDPSAWRDFLSRYSTRLQGAALALVKDKLLARELTDTLFADLFSKAKAPSSKLATYTGSGSLESWLKALLFQANIDRHRSERRFLSFDESIRQLAGSPPRALDSVPTEDANFERSLRAAIQQLASEERFILASHFFDNQNLAEIACLLRVHESTVSRRLRKALAKIRKIVMRQLQSRGLSTPREANFKNIALDLHAELLFGIDTVRDRL